MPPRLPDQHQIAGIDRHAEVLDAPADRFNRRRDDVAPVGDRGGAEHNDQFGAGFQNLIHGLGDGALLVRHAALGDDAGAGRRQAILVTRKVFSTTLIGEEPSSSVETTPTFLIV